MNFLSFIGDIFKPASELIDSLHTSEEEKLSLKQQFFTIQATLYSKALEYEARIKEAQARIIEAEAKSESWLASNWRPMTAVTFVALIVLRWFEVIDPVIISEALEAKLWDVLEICLGGYVIGRSAEKIIPSVAEAIGNLKK